MKPLTLTMLLLLIPWTVTVKAEGIIDSGTVVIDTADVTKMVDTVYIDTCYNLPDTITTPRLTHQERWDEAIKSDHEVMKLLEERK